MDVICRDAAIRWVKTECNPYGKPTLDYESGKRVIKHLEQMPSAEKVLKPVFGDWIWDDEGYHCPECWYHAYDNSLEVITHWKFCPVCGARLKCKESEE